VACVKAKKVTSLDTTPLTGAVTCEHSAE